MTCLGLFSVRVDAQLFEYLVLLDEGLYRLVGMKLSRMDGRMRCRIREVEISALKYGSSKHSYFFSRLAYPDWSEAQAEDQRHLPREVTSLNSK